MARKKGQISKFLVGILLVLLMVGLAGFGVTNFGGQIRSVGEVGDVEIDVNDYARVLNEEMRQLQQRIGQDISLEQARQFGVDGQVLGLLIAQAALEHETNRIGLSVGDAEVQRQLLITQGFRGLDGEFDRDAYEFALERNNLSAKQYEADIRSQTAGTILQSAVASGVNAPDAYSDVMLAYLGERRSFSWLELTEADLDNPIASPSDADLRTYFQENGDQYVLPAAKMLTYAWLSPDDLLDQVDVDDDLLRQLYDDRSAEFNTPERRLVERLVFATSVDAETARARIATGEASFDQIVAERGLELTDIDLGDVTKAALGAAGDVVFAMVEPGISGAVESDLGPALFRVNAILAARSVPFADARDRLAQETSADAARRMVADQIADLDDLLAGGATLEEMAAETDMILGQVSWTGETADGIAAYAAFGSVADQVTEEDFPVIETLEDGGIFALRLDETVPEIPDSFENARAQVAIDWRAAQLTNGLAAKSRALLDQMNSGTALSGLGLPVTVETNAKRDAVYLGKPTGFLQAVFDLEAGGATSLTGGGSEFLLQLNKISAADPLDPQRAELNTAINDSIAQSIGNDALAAFSQALQQSAGISLNQTAINAVHAQFSSTGGGAIPTHNQGMAGGGHN